MIGADPTGTAGTVRVLVVAAYPAVRAGLRAMLDGLGPIVVVGEVSPANVDAGGTAGVDVAVAEVDDDASASFSRLQELLPAVPLVLLAPGREDYARAWSRRSGALALLARDATAEEIGAAVLAVAQGLVVLSPAVASLLAGPSSAAPKSDEHEALTGRELEVLPLLAAGLPNKAIALRLGISEHTVKFHVGAILAKLGATSRTEAVMLAARRGLLAL